MSQTLLSLAGFQVIISGRFWVIAEDWRGLESICKQIARHWGNTPIMLEE